eukprot:TRINITY_DN4400_c0_g1_i8.p2 TRINITY_DN4400_c0_g1~~TRINITY_DN4400_c0_g1_i8.p2  ORF type:complete len:115 (+),score=25.30 TRINITY_DN4400_c0_g1_i8:1920-2264(+)
MSQTSPSPPIPLALANHSPTSFASPYQSPGASLSNIASPALPDDSPIASNKRRGAPNPTPSPIMLATNTQPIYLGPSEQAKADHAKTPEGLQSLSRCIAVASSSCCAVAAWWPL